MSIAESEFPVDAQSGEAKQLHSSKYNLSKPVYEIVYESCYSTIMIVKASVVKNYNR